MENNVQPSSVTTEKNQSTILGIMFGFIGISLLIGARLVLWLKPPIPKCFFKEITGYPCPTCGATRCITELSQFHYYQAFLFNPLFFLTGLALGLYALYSVGIYLFGFPELEFTWIKSKNLPLRFIVITAIVINWIYLIWAHI